MYLLPSPHAALAHAHDPCYDHDSVSGLLEYEYGYGFVRVVVPLLGVMRTTARMTRYWEVRKYSRAYITWVSKNHTSLNAWLLSCYT